MHTTRRLTQFTFVALTLVGVFLVGGNAERWCPFGGVEALYTYINEGNLVCSLGVSNFYILGAVLLMTLLLRRAFCGYVCPIGAISEWLRGAARRLRIPVVRVPAKLDRVLSLLKYAVLAMILYFTWRTAELVFRGYDPCYALLSRHGEDITIWAYVISGALVLASLLIVMPFCRWLCPLAAVLNPFSRIGLTRVQRSEQSCIDCGHCSRVCPMAIPVDRVREVTHARCMSCLECVSACPTRGDGALAWGPPAKWGRAWPQGVLVGLVLLTLGAGVVTSCAIPLPSFMKTRGEAPAETAMLELQLEDLTCRGRANLLVFFLDRDDELLIPGYLHIEAWPGPREARVRLTYDPAEADPDLIRSAITEPFFNLADGIWYSSPFTIVERGGGRAAE